MKSAVFLLVAVILSVPLTSFGDNIDIPAKAKKSTFTLINGLPKCTSPNTETDLFLKSACTYTKPDPTTQCTLTPRGMGQISFQQVGKPDKNSNDITRGTQDILIKVSVKGLSKGCEGLSLFPFIERRRSLDDCNGGQTCILPDGAGIVNDGSEGCKVNEKGSCTFAIGLNKTFPDFFIKNRNMHLQILNCGLTTADGDVSFPLISCGTFLP